MRIRGRRHDRPGWPGRFTRSARGARWVIVAAVPLVLTGGACSAAASSTSSSQSGHRSGHGSGPGGGGRGRARSADVFRGYVVSASGAYAGDTGRADVILHPHGSGRSRAVRVLMRSLPCDGRSNCLRLTGALSGEITERGPQNPDVGRDFSVIASGHISALGRVTGDGNGHGTGFIRRGRETLEITLTNRAGRITLSALSRQVRGFTSP